MDLGIIDQWTRHFMEALQNAPLWHSALVLFFAASIEYVFPPFPGDTIFVVGGFLATKGVIRFEVAIAALFLGTWFGSILGWSIGYFAMRHEWLKRLIMRYVKQERLVRLESLYAKYGNWLLIGSRFLPGIRGFFVMGAGVVRMPLSRVLFWSTLSAMLWNTLLVLIGAWFANNLEAVLGFFENYTRVVFVILVLLTGFLIIRFLRRR